MAIRLCGYTAIWLCGNTTVRLHGYTATLDMLTTASQGQQSGDQENDYKIYCLTFKLFTLHHLFSGVHALYSCQLARMDTSLQSCNKEKIRSIDYRLCISWLSPGPHGHQFSTVFCTLFLLCIVVSWAVWIPGYDLGMNTRNENSCNERRALFGINATHCCELGRRDTRPPRYDYCIFVHNVSSSRSLSVLIPYISNSRKRLHDTLSCIYATHCCELGRMDTRPIQYNCYIFLHNVS